LENLGKLECLGVREIQIRDITDDTAHIGDFYSLASIRDGEWDPWDSELRRYRHWWTAFEICSRVSDVSGGNCTMTSSTIILTADSSFLASPYLELKRKRGRPTELGLVDLLPIEDWQSTQLALLSAWKLHTD
jgi:hypothetical protein